jgi:hypothetical protein
MACRGRSHRRPLTWASSSYIEMCAFPESDYTLRTDALGDFVHSWGSF